MIFFVGMAPGPDFFARIARDQSDEQTRLKHYWRVQKAFDAMRRWGKSIHQRLKGVESRTGSIEKRVSDIERQLKK